MTLLASERRGVDFANFAIFAIFDSCKSNSTTVCLEDLDRCRDNFYMFYISGQDLTCLNSDAVLGEYLQVRSVVGNKSVELLLVPVPLDTVQIVLLHVEVTLEDGLLTTITMISHNTLRTHLSNQLVTRDGEI